MHCKSLSLITCVTSFASFDTNWYTLHYENNVSFDSFDPIIYTVLYTVLCIIVSFFRLFRPHTVNSYNFLNNSPIFNCFTPLELAQSPLFISGCIFVSFDSFNLNAYTVLYNQAVSFDSFHFINNIEEKQPEMNRGD